MRDKKPSEKSSRVKGTYLPKPERVRLLKPGALPALSQEPPRESDLANTPEPSVKQRAIRDSFTMTATDQNLIKDLKRQCMHKGMEITKSQLIRAGIHVLGQMNLTDVLNIVNDLEKLKVGQPRKAK